MVDFVLENSTELSSLITSISVIFAVLLLYIQNQDVSKLFEQINRKVGENHDNVSDAKTWLSSKMDYIHRLIINEEHDPVDMTVAPDKEFDFNDTDLPRENIFINLDRSVGQKLYRFCDKNGHDLKRIIQEAIQNRISKDPNLQLSDDLMSKLESLESKIEDDSYESTRDKIEKTVEQQQESTDLGGDDSESEQNKDSVDVKEDRVPVRQQNDFVENGIYEVDKEEYDEIESEHFDPATPLLVHPTANLNIPYPYDGYTANLKGEFFSVREGAQKQICKSYGSSKKVWLSSNSDSFRGYSCNKLECWYELFIGPLPRHFRLAYDGPLMEGAYCPESIERLNKLVIKKRGTWADPNLKHRKRLPIEVIESIDPVADPKKILQHIRVDINSYQDLEIPVWNDDELMDYLIQCIHESNRKPSIDKYLSNNDDFRPIEDEESKVDVEHSDTGFGLDEEVG